MFSINITTRRVALMMLLLSGLLILQTGCKKEVDDPSPSISRIRANTAAPNDSVLTKILPGQTVVIQGSGFSNIAEVYFNGYPTPFNSGLGTDNNLIVTVPADMPFATLDPQNMNKIRLVTTTGKELIYNFPVVPPAATVSGVNYEFPDPAGGQRMVINGNYLYLIQKIIFPGGKEGANITAANDGSRAEVTIPAGVTETGGLTIVTAGGTTNSAPAVVLNDHAHVFYDFDQKNAFTPWGAKPIIRSAANPYAPIKPLTGNFIHWQATNVTPGTWWMQDLATPSNGGQLAYPSDIPASEPVGNLALKFEINAPGEGLKDGRVEFNFNGAASFWKPAEKGTFVTNGWQTITIPFSGFNGNLGTYGNLKGRSFNIFFVNGDGKVATNVDMGWDNFRIVKIK